MYLYLGSTKFAKTTTRNLQTDKLANFVFKTLAFPEAMMIFKLGTEIRFEKTNRRNSKLR